MIFCIRHSNCFEHVLKNHVEKTDSPLIRIYLNKIQNRKKKESTEVELVHCNIVHNVYQQDSIVLYRIVRNKLFDQF